MSPLSAGFIPNTTPISLGVNIDFHRKCVDALQNSWPDFPSETGFSLAAIPIGVPSAVLPPQVLENGVAMNLPPHVSTIPAVDLVAATAEAGAETSDHN